jgi:hypothetical protein
MKREKPTRCNNWMFIINKGPVTAFGVLFNNTPNAVTGLLFS